jgi:4-hydroxy-tetrahydrodipicolinate synthase
METMSKLQGAFTALITPFMQDFSVDYEAYKSLVRYQLEGGIDGLLPLGTTGETPTLSEEEEEELIILTMKEEEAFYKKTGKKTKVIVGAGSNNTIDAVRYTERAKKHAADAALVVTPYYNKPSDEGIFRHFEACAKVGIPIIVYNIAGRTGKNISTALLSRIAALPNVIGVKEASGDINQMMDVIKTIVSEKPDFSVLSGDDALTLPLMALGGDGVISVVSNIAPKEVTNLVKEGLSGNFSAAKALHYRMLPFFKAAFIDGNPISIKFAMNHKGLPAGKLRLPLVDIGEQYKEIVIEAMKKSQIL